MIFPGQMLKILNFLLIPLFYILPIETLHSGYSFDINLFFSVPIRHSLKDRGCF